jgi:hypothetical protein
VQHGKGCSVAQDFEFPDEIERSFENCYWTETDEWERDVTL